jgi:signal transduction histidine kinase
MQRLRAGERIVHFETTRLTKAGHETHTSVTISPLRDAAGAVIGAARISRDITAQKRAADAVSTVNRRLIEAQEQERSRIARELHDDIGQRLALLTIELAGATSGSETRRLANQASDIAGDIQALSHELHASRLDLLGIEPNVRTFCDDFARRQQVAVNLRSPWRPRQTALERFTRIVSRSPGSPSQLPRNTVGFGSSTSASGPRTALCT